MIYEAKRVFVYGTGRTKNEVRSLSPHLKLIPDSPHRRQRPVGVVLNLFTEPLDMDIYSPGVSDVLIAPDVV